MKDIDKFRGCLIGGAAGDVAHAADEPVMIPLGLADGQAQRRHQRRRNNWIRPC